MIRILSLAFFALVIAACGGSRNGESSQMDLASIVEKLNAQYAQISEGADNSSNPDFKFSIDGKRLILTIQLKKNLEDFSDRERDMQSLVLKAVEKHPEAFFDINASGENKEDGVSGNDVIANLCKNNVDVLAQLKDKKGTLIEELLLDGEKMTAAMSAKAERDKQNAAIMAEIEPGSFTDPRDGHVYKTGTVTDETWIAEDIVYGGESLYGWDDAQKACPEGWRLPSAEDLNGIQFRKFRKDYIDVYNKPVYWSSTIKDGLFGQEIVAVQHGLTRIVKENSESIYEEDKMIDVPMNLANTPEKKHLVRCIKK